MPTSSSNTPTPTQFLGGFASLLSLLGVCLFFAGWIYRWAYYAFFQLELSRLNLSPQSFLLVPLQIFLGSPLSILKSVLIVGIIPILVYLTLWTIRLLKYGLDQSLNRIPKLRVLWHKLSKNNHLEIDSFRFFQSLLDETIIVTWVLLIIFWFARYQGEIDARRDAVNETSTLPAITLITSQRNLILGTDLAILNDEIPVDLAINSNMMLGDINMAKIIRNYGINDISEQRVWRLLTEGDGWIFVFLTLAKNADAKTRPMVLGMPRATGEQLMILSPTPPHEPN